MKTVSGYVENITFRNEDNGFTVLTLSSGKDNINQVPVTLGLFPELIHMSGSIYIQNPKALPRIIGGHGNQFSMRFMENK